MDEMQKCCPLWGDVEKSPVKCGSSPCQWWDEDAQSCCLCAIPAAISETNAHMDGLSETLSGITEALNSVVDALKELSAATSGGEPV